MKTTPLWTPSVKTVENWRIAEPPVLRKLSGRRPGIFWVSQASAATGPIWNYAENLLRKTPQYNIICSN